MRATDSGLTLFDWIRDGGGQVAVCDVMMPDCDGLDLLPKIRGLRPDLPVIMMSAKNNVLTALRASEGGAFDYLPKPFDLEALGDAVVKALSISHTAPQDHRLGRIWICPLWGLLRRCSRFIA